MANTPNEAVASIKTRTDAVDAISSLYGFVETDLGREFFLDLVCKYRHEVFDWIPDDKLIELAQMHIREEWKGYPWNARCN